MLLIGDFITVTTWSKIYPGPIIKYAHIVLHILALIMTLRGTSKFKLCRTKVLTRNHSLVYPSDVMHVVKYGVDEHLSTT